MTFEESVLYLESFINYEKKATYNYKTAFKLERIRKFLANLGNPQEQLKIIHVAGTKGKGSTSCFIAQILQEQGFRVGLYTSPHLVDFRERIRILDANNTADAKSSFPGMILKNEFAQLLTQLEPQIDFFRRSIQGFGALSFFEVLTAMAFKHFRDRGVDWVVLETGLGGRLDATNASRAHVCVLTPISYDHEQILGPTLTDIAFEKAGIIKNANQQTDRGVGVAVCAAQDKEVMNVFRRRAKAEGAALLEMEKDFSFKRLGGDLNSQDFFYRGLNDRSHFFNIRMLGNHQLVNASLAVAACEALALFGVKITDEAMARGLQNAHWPGRLEVVRTKPFIILDGAHNKDSAGRLAHFLGKEFKSLRKWAVFGVSEDKDIKGLVERLEPMVDRVILTRSTNPRAADPEKVLKPFFRKEPHRVTSSVQEALDVLAQEIGPDDVAVITGSLFVVGEAKSLWLR